MKRNTFANSERLFKKCFTETYYNSYAIALILLSLHHKDTKKINKIK